MKSEAIDFAETLITHLLLADASDMAEAYQYISKRAKRGAGVTEIPENQVLGLGTMAPSDCYAFDGNIERLFTLDPKQLLAHPSEIIGSQAEIAFLMDDHAMWMGLRRIRKLPRGMGVIGKAAALYELHSRKVSPDGFSTYTTGVAALSATGQPLICMLPNSRDSGIGDGKRVVLAASAIEDVGRTGHFTASVSEAVTISFPVPYGEQVELFRLRDAPLLANGRRRAILHWVAKHIRRRGDKCAEVKSHTRGVEQFECDGLTVRLQPNDVLS